MFLLLSSSEGSSFVQLVTVIPTLLILALVVGQMLRGRRGGRDPFSGFRRYHDGSRFAVQRKLSDPEAAAAQGFRVPQIRLRTKMPEITPKKVAVVRFDGKRGRGDHTVLAKLIDELDINRALVEEVVVIIDSPGGPVHTYGHAYAQMERIRDLGLRLTVCVDTVAASGGYLMALPAHRIIAAPFAYVGSIGVVASIPNFRKLFERLGITPRIFTSGKRKRTLHLLDEDGPEERSHFQAKLVSIHDQFLAALRKYRPDAKFDEVREADSWTAEEALKGGLGLIDEIGTSSSYLLKRNREADLVFVGSRVSPFQHAGDQIAAGLLTRLEHWMSSAHIG